MIVLDAYPLPPYACVRCRMPKTPVVDWQHDDDENPRRGSRIYTCVDCVLEAAGMVADSRGLVVTVADTIDAVRVERDAALRRAVDAERLVVQFREAAAVIHSFVPKDAAADVPIDPARHTYETATAALSGYVEQFGPPPAEVDPATVDFDDPAEVQAWTRRADAWILGQGTVRGVPSVTEVLHDADASTLEPEPVQPKRSRRGTKT